MAKNPETRDLLAFHRKLDALPTGPFRGTSGARRYVVAKTLFQGGKSVKLVAEELGGSDYISLNLYHLRNGPRLFPCEMSREKVMEFVLSLRADQDQEAE